MKAQRELAKLLAQRNSAPSGLSAPQLPHSSLEDGAIHEYDASGNLVSIIGKQYDGTHGAVVVSGPVPPTPTAPVLTGGLGLTGGWDGVFVDDSGQPDITIPSPLDYTRTELHVSKTQGFQADTADTLAGTLESPRGGSISMLVEPGTWYAVLVARASSGKRSAQSAETMAVVEPPVGADIDVDALRKEFQDAQDALQQDLIDNATAQAALENTVTTLRDTTLPALESELDAAGGRLDAADQLLNVTFPKRLTDAEASASNAQTRATAAEAAATKAAADLVTAKARADAAATAATTAAAEADAAEAAATRATGAAGVAETAADKARQDAAAALTQAQNAGGNVSTAQAAATAAQAAADTAKTQATAAGTSAAAADAKAAQAAADAAKAAADALVSQQQATKSASEASTAKTQATTAATKATAAETAAATAKTRADAAAVDAAAAATRATAAETSATRATGAAGTAETAADKAARDAAAALAQAQNSGTNATAAQTAASNAKTASDAAAAAAATAGTRAAAADAAAASAAAKAAQAAADLVVAQNAAADARGDANTAVGRADSALTMAGSAARVLYSTANPSGTAREGDTWRKTTSDVGDVLGEWRYTKNSAGVLAWRPQKVTNDMVSNLDIGKLTAGSGTFISAVAEKMAIATASIQKADIRNLTVTGDSALNTLTAQRIAAGVATFLSITTDQLVAGTAQINELVARKLAAETGAFMKLTANQVFIGEAGNLERDPNFEQPDGWSVDNIPPVSRYTDGGYNKANAVGLPLPLDTTKISGAWRYTPDGRFSFPVTAGEKYRISCWVQSDKDVPIQSAVMHVRASTPDGGYWGVPVLESAQNKVLMKAGVWYKITETVTIPANATSAFLGYFRFSRAAGAVIRFSTPTVQQAITPSLIVDGFFQGLRVVGASVETNEAANRGVKIDDNGLRVYDANGNAYMLADSTGVTMIGTVTSEGTSYDTPDAPTSGSQYRTRAILGRKFKNSTKSLDKSPGLWLEAEKIAGAGSPTTAFPLPAGVTSSDDDALGVQMRSARQNADNQLGTVTATPLYVEMKSAGAKVAGYTPRTNIWLNQTMWEMQQMDENGRLEQSFTAGNNTSDPELAWMELMSTKGIRLTAPKVEVNGALYGAPQVRVQPTLNSGWTMWTNASWNGIWIEQMGKLTIISGAVGKSSWREGETIAVIPARYRPANKAAGTNCEVQPNGNLNVGPAGTAAAVLSISYFAA